MCSKERIEMKSDVEFYRGEYLKCCELYRTTPVYSKRLREFYDRLSVSMLEAYIEAVNTEMA